VVSTASWQLHVGLNTVYNRHYMCIIRPHRSTTYADVAYCYRRTGWSVGPSDGRSVTIVIPAKTAEAIEIPFEL